MAVSGVSFVFEGAVPLRIDFPHNPFRGMFPPLASGTIAFSIRAAGSRSWWVRDFNSPVNPRRESPTCCRQGPSGRIKTTWEGGETSIFLRCCWLSPSVLAAVCRIVVLVPYVGGVAPTGARSVLPMAMVGDIHIRRHLLCCRLFRRCLFRHRLFRRRGELLVFGVGSHC